MHTTAASRAVWVGHNQAQLDQTCDSVNAPLELNMLDLKVATRRRAQCEYCLSLETSQHCPWPWLGSKSSVLVLASDLETLSWASEVVPGFIWLYFYFASDTVLIFDSDHLFPFSSYWQSACLHTENEILVFRSLLVVSAKKTFSVVGQSWFLPLCIMRKSLDAFSGWSPCHFCMRMRTVQTEECCRPWWDEWLTDYYVCVGPAGEPGECPLRARWVLLHAGTFTARVHALPGRPWLAAARATNWSGRVWESCATQANILQVRPALAQSHQRGYQVPGRARCQRSHWMPKEEGKYCLQLF